ncbi:MAG TPA: RNA methyltransferase [Ignavibacteriaceae bacterium]|nr:RNA methyltransferase [Ignavibacteriaceae bacterium]
MKSFRTDRREKKIISVANTRQKYLRVVLENIHDPHNVSAIFRTCDAVGVPKVSLIYTKEKFPKIGRKTSGSAFKWVERDKFTSIKECYTQLRNEGFKIYASSLSENTKNIYDLDFTEKTAIVLGNEHRGVSEEAANLADVTFAIPMFGMVQSLNVSVAAAVILYEALRQRDKKNLYLKSEYTEEELNQLIEVWCKK